MAFVQVELGAEAIADAMNEDAEFMLQVLSVLSERTNMGLLRDNAADLGMSMTPDRAAYIFDNLTDLASAVRDGFNNANLEQI
jgi:hypothetical protein